MPKSLAAWLSYIERLHTKPIVLGLDRVKSMVDRVHLAPTFPIITVAGTNGKGSCCAMLERIYGEAGYRVGCYTSPHLLRYNERVRINGSEVSDADLCAAFAAIETARVGADDHPIALTYFEIGTLAAMWHFMQSGIDVAILEIGLGGRLDAVNAFEPSCAIVTSVDLDHQDFLGDTREEIGYEKSGVYRQSIPAICGEKNPPASLLTYAKEIQADLKCVHQDFDYQLTVEGWQYLSAGKIVYTLPMPALQGAYQLNNAACAIAAIESLQSSLPVTAKSMAEALRQVTLAGRFQTVSQSPWVVLDVAHNPHAARALSDNLKLSQIQKTGKTFAVFAMLADKDIRGVVEAVKADIDLWYVASIDDVRGASATDVATIITEVQPSAVVKIFDRAEAAYLQACIDIEACIDYAENDKIVVFGSFFTVSSVMQSLIIAQSPPLRKQ
ncbi:bifunctional protein FolC [mine drainage metagenome]|uniref:Bifunctional protein FolC n=1 Tax=mine drainage metagenome TaxID=410659 RepID=A0A1J5SWV6_9ZZZZ